MDWEIILRFAASASIGVVLLTGGVAIGWAVWRDPAKRVVDFLHFRRYWRGGFTRLAALPQRWERTLLKHGVLSYERRDFEVEPGMVLTLDPKDHIAGKLLAGNWENTEWKWLAPNLQPGGTFVDIGAHIGVFTIRASKVVGNLGQVIAIEPNPETLRDLLHNIALSGVKNVKVHPFACGDTRTKLKLFPGPTTNSGMTSLSQWNTSASSPGWDVEVIRLDDLLESENLGRLDVLKIDVEGAETLVLAGARHSIKRFSPIIMVETIEQQLRGMGSSCNELYELLASLGYSRVAYNSVNALFAPAKRH
jgi:FkbM family methyltransferase